MFGTEHCGQTFVQKGQDHVLAIPATLLYLDEMIKGVVVALVVEDVVLQESKILIPSAIVVVHHMNLLPSTEYQHNNQLGDQFFELKDRIWDMPGPENVVIW
eukprot:3664312-Ditylum_brightwellii.AAC.2